MRSSLKFLKLNTKRNTYLIFLNDLMGLNDASVMNFIEILYN